MDSKNSNVFEWDAGNVKHVLEHPTDKSRNNTIEEVESLFNDPFFRPDIQAGSLEKYGEERYTGVAVGNEGLEKHVVFVVRNDKIRPVTCRRANRKQRKAYHEIVDSYNHEERSEDG